MRFRAIDKFAPNCARVFRVASEIRFCATQRRTEVYGDSGWFFQFRVSNRRSSAILTARVQRLTMCRRHTFLADWPTHWPHAGTLSVMRLCVLSDCVESSDRIRACLSVVAWMWLIVLWSMTFCCWSSTQKTRNRWFEVVSLQTIGKPLHGHSRVTFDRCSQFHRCRYRCVRPMRCVAAH